MYLMTYGGFLLAETADGSGLEQVTLDSPRALARALQIPAAPETLHYAYNDFIEGDDRAWEAMVQGGVLDGYWLRTTGGTRTVSLSKAGLHVCAEPAGFGAKVHMDRTSAGDWERFLCVEDADLLRILEIMRQDWVIADKRRVFRSGQITLREGFQLSFESIGFDLRYNLPLPRQTHPLRMTLLRDGWRIEHLFVFRPLMIFTAFKSPEVLRQLYIALDSLIRFAGYTGDVWVITDQDASLILDKVPAVDPGRLSILHSRPADWVGFVASKYLIVDQPELLKYQPVVFNDPDMVFDATITQMLAMVAASDRIAVPVEHDSPLRSKSSTGADLIRDDGCDPRFACGFNAGTIAIPNMQDHVDTLAVIQRIIVNRAQIMGRGHHRWVDQEIANYVSYKFGGFDQALISPFVRYGYPWVETSPEDAVGIVHFWPPPGSAAKRVAMEQYVKLLERRAGARSR